MALWYSYFYLKNFSPVPAAANLYQDRCRECESIGAIYHTAWPIPWWLLHLSRFRRQRSRHPPLKSGRDWRSDYPGQPNPYGPNGAVAQNFLQWFQADKSVFHWWRSLPVLAGCPAYAKARLKISVPVTPGIRHIIDGKDYQLGLKDSKATD